MAMGGEHIGVSTRFSFSGDEARIVVVEPTPSTAPTLQRQFGELATVRPLNQLEDFPFPTECDLLVVRLGERVDQSIRKLAGIKVQSPHLRILVIASKRMASLEWTLREIGINAVLSEFTPSPQLSAVCHRLLRDTL